MKQRLRTLLTLILLLCGVPQAQAGLVYTLNDTANGVSATATFTAVDGGLQISIVNTESGTADAGHAISQIRFTFGGAVNPGKLTEIQGTATDFQNPTTSVDAKTSSDFKTVHWSYSVSKGTANLWTVDGNGLSGYGGQPDYLIVAAGSTPNSSLTNTHIPSFIGEVDFFLADHNLTAGQTLTTDDIKSVAFSFGTGPEVDFDTAVHSNPEPTSLALLALGGLGIGGYAWRRRRQQTVTV